MLATFGYVRHPQILTHNLTYQVPDIAWLKRGGGDGRRTQRNEGDAYKKKERKIGQREQGSKINAEVREIENNKELGHNCNKGNKDGKEAAKPGGSCSIQTQKRKSSSYIQCGKSYTTVRKWVLVKKASAL